MVVLDLKNYYCLEDSEFKYGYIVSTAKKEDVEKAIFTIRESDWPDYNTDDLVNLLNKRGFETEYIYPIPILF